MSNTSQEKAEAEMLGFRSILVVAGNEGRNEAALTRAVSLAKKNEASLSVISVVDPLPGEWGTLMGCEMVLNGEGPINLHVRAIEATAESLEELVGPIRSEGLEVGANVRVGRPFVEVMREVLRNGHDLVVVTGEAPGGLLERLFGSTARLLIERCPCPVWVIEPTQEEPLQRILAAVDPAPGDETRMSLNRSVTEIALSLASQEGSELHFVRPWSCRDAGVPQGRGNRSSAAAEQLVDELGKAYQDWLSDFLMEFPMEDIPGQEHLVMEEPAVAITNLARSLEADLIVMGTVPGSGISGMLIGGAAKEVLRRVDCSVLAVKPDGFALPVTLME